jgi:hypothetical protein
MATARLTSPLACPTTAAQRSQATLPPAPMAPLSTQALAAPLALQFRDSLMVWAIGVL